MTARNALATQSPKLFHNYENKLYHSRQYINKNTWFMENSFIHSSNETIVCASPWAKCGRLKLKSDPEPIRAKGSS